MVTRLPNASQQAAADAVVDRIDATAGAGTPAVRVDLVWDCQVRDVAGFISTVDSGLLVVEPDVTRATS